MLLPYFIILEVAINIIYFFLWENHCDPAISILCPNVARGSSQTSNRAIGSAHTHIYSWIYPRIKYIMYIRVYIYYIIYVAH